MGIYKHIKHINSYKNVGIYNHGLIKLIKKYNYQKEIKVINNFLSVFLVTLNHHKLYHFQLSSNRMRFILISWAKIQSSFPIFSIFEFFRYNSLLILILFEFILFLLNYAFSNFLFYCFNLFIFHQSFIALISIYIVFLPERYITFIKIVLFTYI